VFSNVFVAVLLRFNPHVELRSLQGERNIYVRNSKKYNKWLINYESNQQDAAI